MIPSEYIFTLYNKGIFLFGSTYGDIPIKYWKSTLMDHTEVIDILVEAYLLGADKKFILSAAAKVDSLRTTRSINNWCMERGLRFLRTGFSFSVSTGLSIERLTDCPLEAVLNFYDDL
jgi:hypothetical protein